MQEQTAYLATSSAFLSPEWLRHLAFKKLLSAPQVHLSTGIAFESCERESSQLEDDAAASLDVAILFQLELLCINTFPYLPQVNFQKDMQL